MELRRPEALGGQDHCHLGSFQLGEARPPGQALAPLPGSRRLGGRWAGHRPLPWAVLLEASGRVSRVPGLAEVSFPKCSSGNAPPAQGRARGGPGPASPVTQHGHGSHTQHRRCRQAGVRLAACSLQHPLASTNRGQLEITCLSVPRKPQQAAGTRGRGRGTPCGGAQPGPQRAREHRRPCIYFYLML